MNVEEAIKTRRSIMPDQYIDKEISKELILKILESANYAPNHKLTAPWRFKVITGETREELGLFLANKFKDIGPTFSEFKYNKIKENPKKAAAVIAICMQRDQKESVPEWEEIAAVAMAVQNMWLMATELEIGSYWSSPPLIKYMHEFFDLAKGEVCLGFFYMGYFHTPSTEKTLGAIDEKIVWL